MLCPSCRAASSEHDLYCRNCGAELGAYVEAERRDPIYRVRGADIASGAGDLAVPSKSLVPTRRHLPAMLNKLQLPHLAASVGAVAAGVGLELLRRTLLARLAKPSRVGTRFIASPLPTLEGLREMLTPQTNKKLPKDYEVHETIVYMRRVIRRAK